MVGRAEGGVVVMEGWCCIFGAWCWGEGCNGEGRERRYNREGRDRGYDEERLKRKQTVC
jgi:hypothetical protein